MQRLLPTPKRRKRGNPNISNPNGRPKGALNKTTKLVKEAISEAFVKLGGVDAMVRWARKYPTPFYAHVLPKLLPLQVNHEGGVDVTLRAIHRVIIDPVHDDSDNADVIDGNVIEEDDGEAGSDAIH